MWNWLSIILVLWIIFLLIEELSQFIWREYLRNPEEKEETIFTRLAENIKRIYQNRKNPSH